jgi:hypothetical protein
MTNPIEPARKPASERGLAVYVAGSAAAGIGALRRSFAPIMAWARLTKGSLRFGGPDAAVALDMQSRRLLWNILIETISAVGIVGASDAPLEAALDALRELSDRARSGLAASPPRGTPSPGFEPPQIFVLEMLTHDLQPCLGRWQARLEVWRAAGRREADWPLRQGCRDDLARTRERLVERAWQLGMALDLPGLGRLLPERPAVVPALTSPAEFADADTAAAASPNAAALRAGWQIYVEAATRIPERDLPTGPGVLGEAIASLDMLASEIRTGLKAMPSPAAPDGGADTIQALALSLLNDGVLPFLADWGQRYRRFAALERPETKWRRAEACRAGLAAACARCQPTIRALGRQVGAPILPEPKTAPAPAEEEAPLQLPPPLATRP